MPSCRTRIVPPAGRIGVAARIAVAIAATITAAAALGILAISPSPANRTFAARAPSDEAAAGASTPAERGDVTGRADAPDRTESADRVREGTRWQNERGIFTLVGDRVTFTNQQKQNFVVLENLNLERIVRTIEENRTVTDADTLEWNIDATVTEFRGQNFILVSRSVLIARPRGTDAAR